MPDLLRAWHEWSSAVIAAPLLQELQLAAAEAKLSLPQFVAEVLECAAASRRLPHVEQSPHRNIHLPEHAPRLPGSAKDSDDDEHLFPAEVYVVSRPRRSDHVE